MASSKNPENRPKTTAGETEIDRNEDPITGQTGAHPVGVGLGAAGAGAVGAAVGMAAGPVGAAIGAAVGAVAGGLAGKGVAEAIDPTVEDEYWSEVYRTRPYVDEGDPYALYQPAYKYGWESRGQYADRSFDEIEPELEKDWTKARGSTSHIEWPKARFAVRDAWDRVGVNRAGGVRG